MLFDVKAISTLQKLWLTLYGAKAYVALVSTITPAKLQNYFSHKLKIIY